MNSLTITFDPARLDRDRVYGWLSREAYWSIGMGRERLRSRGRPLAGRVGARR